ncbi:MAG: 2-phosphosulfolactate phosphatase [Bacteroidetes bacterium]|nr:2-phosphosulfolactate phosphatase [Bacteroidota bacterium]
MTTHSLSIEVIFAPSLYSSRQIRINYAVVVVDILRAGTTICAALHAGAEKIIPVATIEKAVLLKEKGFLVTGERDGKKLNFADFGNSPIELSNGQIKGQTVVISTTNGTRAVETAHGADVIVIGAFTNLKYLTEWLSSLDKNIVILCAGWRETFSLEDSIFAGALTESLIRRQDKYILHDSASAAQEFWLPARHDLSNYLKKSSHYQRLVSLGSQEDLDYAGVLNSTPVIPFYEDNFFKNIYK